MFRRLTMAKGNHKTAAQGNATAIASAARASFGRMQRKLAGQYLTKCRQEAGFSRKEISRTFKTFYDKDIDIHMFEVGIRLPPPDMYKMYSATLRITLKKFTSQMLRFSDPITYAILTENDELYNECTSLYLELQKRARG